MDVTTTPSSREARFRRNSSWERTKAKPILYADIVTRAALSGGAETWFDAYWYREAPNARDGHLREVARMLWDRIAATRMCGVGWWMDLGKVFPPTAGNSAPGTQRF
jgi:hypothetical protein